LKQSKRLNVVLVLVLAILLEACAGQPGPSATLANTPATATLNAVTAIPSPVPTEAPTSTPPPSSTSSSTLAPATVPAATATPAATASPAATAAPDAVLVAAGDIASCLSTGDEATAQLVSAITGTVATLGDNVYERGSGEEFKTCFDPSWGAFKDRIRPAPGNHEYLTPGAQGYFTYYGAAAGKLGQGYYSYELGAWHIVVLNSQCWEIGGCGAAAPQSQWLKADLAAHPGLCTLAYWHVPRFSSGAHGDSTLIQAFWDVLYAAGADVVLNGHDHDYERFAPQDPQGQADPARGIREFVVGTGGRSHYPFLLGPHANTEVRNDATYGVLKLTLHDRGYDWEFVPVAGQTFTDAGSGACH
jgi:Calcineurin-like phosphoesterase